MILTSKNKHFYELNSILTSFIKNETKFKASNIYISSLKCRRPDSFIVDSRLERFRSS